MQLQEHYIITLRNPLASAKSFSLLTELDLEVCLLLWLMHTLPAIEDTHGKNRIVVSYEQMIQNPRKELERIKHQLHIPDLAPESEIEIFANEFLDKNLNRHGVSEEDLKNHPAIASATLCISVYELLYRVAKDELTFECDEFKYSWQKIMTEFEKIYPLYRLLDKVLRQNKTLKKNNS